MAFDIQLRDNGVGVFDVSLSSNPPSKLYFRNTQANGITSGGVACYDLLTTQGSTLDTAVVTATASGTDIQWTKTAGGSILVFATGRVPSGGWTITNVDLAAWFKESVATVNAGARVRFYKWSGGTETLIAGGPFDDGVEFTTTDAEYTWLADVTDTALAEDDRLIVKLYLTNVGTMGAGDATFSFNTDTGSGGTVTPVDAAAKATPIVASSASVISFSYTTTSLADALVIDVGWGNFAANPTITGVTFNGVSATAIANTKQDATVDGQNCSRQSYILVAPSIGTFTVQANFSGNFFMADLVARSYKNVHQTTPTEGGNPSTGASGTSRALAPTTTTVNGDYLHGGLVVFGSTATVSCSDTELSETDWGAIGTIIVNNGEAASTGSGNTLDFSTTSNSTWLGSVFVLKASTLPATNSYINVYPAVTFKAEDSGVTGTGATSQAQTAIGSGSFTPAAVTATGNTSQAQTSSGSGSFTPASVTITGATSQAQTSSGSGSFTAAVVTGTGATSQAQTSSGSGAFATGVDGTGSTSQVQTADGSGSFTLAAVDGSGSTSQAQTADGSATFTLAAVTGSGATSQAQTSDGSGVFTAAGVVNGIGSTSQAQTSSGVSEFVSGVTPAVTQPSGGISHAGKRYYIERNGKRIFFYDEREVYDLLYAEEEKLVKKAKKKIQAVTKENVTVENFQFITPPVLVLKFNDAGFNKEVAKINERLQAVFMKALMARVEEIEEEEVFLALLFN